MMQVISSPGWWGDLCPSLPEADWVYHFQKNEDISKTYVSNILSIVQKRNQNRQDIASGWCR